MEGLVFPESVEVEELSDSHARIVLSPLERGMGNTLGNSLRRVLLSMIPGGAVVRVNFSGKYHEYDTIEGVKEDVLEIILNLKSLSLRVHGDELKRLTIEKRGPGEVKAGDIQLDAGVEIINPDLHIATLNAKGALNMELEVAVGYGYRPAEMNKLENAPLAVIPIDSDFSPVRKVSFTVNDTRVGGRTGYERLTMSLETDGGIRPEEAISEAVNILQRQLRLFEGFAAHPFGLAAEEGEEVEDSLRAELLTELNFDQRACNLLKEAEILTLGDLLSCPREELLDIHGFGAKTLTKAEERLRELGFTLKGEEEMRDAPSV